MIKKFRKKPIVIEAIQWTGENTTEVLGFMDLAPVKTNGIMIDTKEGLMNVSKNDWVIRGINGEFYPCKPDIFDKTYDPVEPREVCKLCGNAVDLGHAPSCPNSK